MAVDPNDLADDIVDMIEADTGNDQIAAARVIWLAVSKAAAPYFTTGGSGVAQVTAGSSKVSVSPTTGNVVVDVVPGNFTGIPESAVTGLVADLAALAASIAGKANASHTHAQSDITGLAATLAGKADLSHTHAQSDITNLTTDLAAKVPTTRNVNTTSPLTGGGALSSDLTLGIDISSLVGASADYGDGFDGNATFDGVNPVTGFSLAGSVYTATRSVYFLNGSAAAGVSLVMAGNLFKMKGKLTVTGTGNFTIHTNGASAVSATGAAGAATNYLPGGRSGGNGGTNAIGGAGGNSGAPSWNGRCTTTAASNGGAIATVGGAGALPFRGGGGGGGATTNAGGTGGTTTQPASNGGGPSVEYLSKGVCGSGSSVTFAALTNGSGGGGGAGGAAGTGGGGGGGGGYLLCHIHEIEVPVGAVLLLQSNGGNGFNGTGTGGGGGGGGGGHNILYYASKTGTATQQCNGGSAGAGGTGAAGGAGNAGQNYLFQTL